MNGRLKRTLIRAAAALAFFLLMMWLMSAVESATTIVVVAFGLAYIFNPVVTRLESVGLSRSVGALAVILIAVSAMVAAVVIVIPAILGEIGRFASVLPKYWDGFQKSLLQLVQTLNLETPTDWGEIGKLALERGKKMLPGIADYGARMFASVFQSTLQAISTFFYAIMILVVAYYLMVSFEHIRTEAIELIPPYARDGIVTKLREIDVILASFIRGQLIIALLLGILYSVGFLIIGIDLALVLGLLSGVLWIIPYVGTLVGLVAGSAMALAKYGDLAHVAYVVGWIGVVQLLEGYVLTPRIVGQAVGLHPVVYILALIVGANLFGFVGMLVAIPVTASLKVLLMAALESYKESYLYKDPEAAETDR